MLFYGKGGGAWVGTNSFTVTNLGPGIGAGTSFTGGSIVVYIAFYAIFFSTFISSTTFTSASSTGDFSGVFVGFFVIWGILLVVGLINVVFSIIGAVKAFKGEPFSYPLLGGL